MNATLDALAELRLTAERLKQNAPWLMAGLDRIERAIEAAGARQGCWSQFCKCPGQDN